MSGRKRSGDGGEAEVVERFEVRGDFIQLDRFLKASGMTGSGGAAHLAVEAGEVMVDGQPESRKRAKLRPGQRVSFAGKTFELVPEGAG